MPTDNLAESRSVRTCKDEHAHNPTTHIGAEMHRALPPPLLKIKKCVYRYDFGVTVDDAICFKTSYSLDVPRITPFA